MAARQRRLRQPSHHRTHSSAKVEAQLQEMGILWMHRDIEEPFEGVTQEFITCQLPLVQSWKWASNRKRRG
jgi:hypothetical protein